jgi:hypothetical protein
MVGGATQVIVLTGPNAVPYTFIVTPATKISVGGRKPVSTRSLHR